jgi:hypothetical protein
MISIFSPLLNLLPRCSENEQRTLLGEKAISFKSSSAIQRTEADPFEADIHISGLPGKDLVTIPSRNRAMIRMLGTRTLPRFSECCRCLSIFSSGSDHISEETREES